MKIEKTTHLSFSDDLSNLLPQVAVCSFKNGEIIFQEGTAPQGVYFVTSGQVKAYKCEGKKLEQQIATYGHANCFGYLPVLQTSTHQFSAVAHGDVDVLRIDEEVFLTHLVKSPAFASLVFANLTNELTSYLNRLKFIRTGMAN